jgi:hypothetical protein
MENTSKIVKNLRLKRFNVQHDAKSQLILSLLMLHYFLIKKKALAAFGFFWIVPLLFFASRRET